MNKFIYLTTDYRVYNEYIKVYFGYANDIFILFKGINREAKVIINNFLKKLYSHLKRKQIIKLTSYTFNFNIYRKQTQTGIK